MSAWETPPPSYHTLDDWDREDSNPDDATTYQHSASPSGSYRNDATEDQRSPSPSESPDGTKLIIGLDFGTTHSGVAYAYSDDPDNVYTIKDWPYSESSDHDKCPTLIQYLGDGDFVWGYQVDRSSSSCIEGIKQLFNRDTAERRATYYGLDTNVELELRRLGKTPVEVAVDYLRAILQHSLGIIESLEPQGYVDSLTKQYVLSVPAIWPEKAKDTLLEAARTAGIHPVELINDPEAGALSTTSSMVDGSLKVGDPLVLCDAGAETVDLVTYQITNLRPLRLAELTARTGGLEASVMINRHFEAALRDAIYDKTYTKLHQKDIFRIVMRQFDEQIKPGFTSAHQKTQYVTFKGAKLPKDRKRGLVHDTFELTGAKLLCTMLEPVFKQVRNLMDCQVNSARNASPIDVKVMVLIGELSCSEYLFKELNAMYRGVRVIRPDDTRSAIARGAVLSQMPLQARVVTDCAPKHYGFMVREIAGRTHPKSYFDANVGKWCVKTVAWHIEKGEQMDRPHMVNCRAAYNLWECSLDSAPHYLDDRDVIKHCILHCDLSTVPKSQFQEFEERSPYDDDLRTDKWILHYEVVLTIRSGLMLFTLQCEGEDYGEIWAEY